jgi:hypothetical protein
MLLLVVAISDQLSAISIKKAAVSLMLPVMIEMSGHQTHQRIFFKLIAES